MKTIASSNATHSIARRAVWMCASALIGSQLLAGCAPLLVGGAVVGGALVATDRRTSGIQLEDEGIQIRAGRRIPENIYHRSRINLDSYNRQLLITGQVPTQEDKQELEKIFSQVENVRSIVNELEVGFMSSLSRRSSDTLVTGRVKASLIDAKDLSANAFKVTTENGVTYLMGRVTQREAERATEITRAVPGVQRVVRVFEFISEEDLQRMLPQPPAPGTKPGSSNS
jgi:osmotically-inducible protein OsmY